MGEEMELSNVDVPTAQRRTLVWRHPERDTIHALIRKGKSARWISEWLKEEYPLEDEWGQPHPDGLEHRKHHVSASTINEYRREWMPECEPGVDVVHAGLEKIIGHRPPSDKTGFELDVMEAAIAVAQHNLAIALKQDQDMGMLQPITLEAQDRLESAAKTRVELAQKLNVPGYEQQAQKFQIQSENRNLNLNVDAGGNAQANEPDKLKLMRELLAQGPDRAREIVNRATSAVQPPPPDADVIDAEELP
jgi:hypothetical protein